MLIWFYVKGRKSESGSEGLLTTSQHSDSSHPTTIGSPIRLPTPVKASARRLSAGSSLEKFNIDSPHRKYVPPVTIILKTFVVNFDVEEI